MNIESMFRGNQARIGSSRQFLTSLKDYFDIGLISKITGKASNKSADLNIISDRLFWNEAINSNLYPGQIVKLNNYKMLEWIPSSPGRYHTNDAKFERDEAYRRHLEKERRKGIDPKKGRFIELSPGDKRSMIKGGLGSLRMGPKQVSGELKYLMCASSEGISHEGIIVLLNQAFYEQVISEIRDSKNPTVNLVGRIMLIPKELSLLNLEHHREVPKYYLDIEECTIVKNENPHQGMVSVAITYTNETNLISPGAFSYSFCQFSPSQVGNDLTGIVDWLSNYAMKYTESESPIIVGDFDEYHDHFEKVDFPIADLANGRFSIENLHKYQKLFKFEINEITMRDNYNINKSQVGAVGPNSKSEKNKFQQNDYSVPENLDYNSLSIELARLKEALLSKANSAEDYQAIAEVTEAENASKKNEGSKVVQHLLTGGKWVFNTAKDIGVEVVAELINKQMI